MVAISFSVPELKEKVRDGTKRQTIRPLDKDAVKASLRIRVLRNAGEITLWWMMRTPGREKLAVFPGPAMVEVIMFAPADSTAGWPHVTKVFGSELGSPEQPVPVDFIPLTAVEMEGLAVKDGFPGYHAFESWFTGHYGQELYNRFFAVISW